jgi:hypothetical protein
VLLGAWLAGRHGCGGPTSLAVDDLASALRTEVAEVPERDARLVASGWVRRHCRDLG